MPRTTDVRILARIALLSLAAACVGCPANLDDPARFLSADGALLGGGACGDVTQTVFLPVCAQAACHSTATKQQSLDLQAPSVATRLVGIHSSEGAGLLIDPSNPNASVIYTKLTATPPFGVRMPFALTPLDDATIACVLQWVNAQVPASAGDAASPGTDADQPPSDDGSTPTDASSGGDTTVAPPGMDSGTPPKDSGTPPVKDAGPEASAPEASVPDASAPKDSGATADASTD